MGRKALGTIIVSSYPFMEMRSYFKSFISLGMATVLLALSPGTGFYRAWGQIVATSAGSYATPAPFVPITTLSSSIEQAISAAISPSQSRLEIVSALSKIDLPNRPLGVEDRTKIALFLLRTRKLGAGGTLITGKAGKLGSPASQAVANGLSAIRTGSPLDLRAPLSSKEAGVLLDTLRSALKDLNIEDISGMEPDDLAWRCNRIWDNIPQITKTRLNPNRHIALQKQPTLAFRAAGSKNAPERTNPSPKKLLGAPESPSLSLGALSQKRFDQDRAIRRSRRLKFTALEILSALPAAVMLGIGIYLISVSGDWAGSAKVFFGLSATIFSIRALLNLLGLLGRDHVGTGSRWSRLRDMASRLYPKKPVPSLRVGKKNTSHSLIIGPMRKARIFLAEELIRYGDMTEQLMRSDGLKLEDASSGHELDNAILGHELSHIWMRHPFWHTLARSFAWATAVIAYDFLTPDSGLIWPFAVLPGLFILTWILVAKFSQFHEYLADAGGALLASSGEMLRFLNAADEPSRSRIGRTLRWLFAHHPTPEKRIKALRKRINSSAASGRSPGAGLAANRSRKGTARQWEWHFATRESAGQPEDILKGSWNSTRAMKRPAGI